MQRHGCFPLVSFHVVSSWFSPLRSAIQRPWPITLPPPKQGTPLERTGWRFSREGMYPNVSQLCLFKRFILQDAKNTGHFLFLFSTSQNRERATFGSCHTLPCYNQLYMRSDGYQLQVYGNDVPKKDVTLR